MSSRLSLSLLLLVGAIAAGPTAASAPGPGITGTTILLGGTSPDSGIARGASAYFRYVNARGGVNGRRIEYIVAEDGEDPAASLEATRRLVEEDGVFALVNAVGTEQNLATREYLNAARVPQLFIASGADTFGRDYAKYPWTIGFQPSYQAEGWVYGQYLARTKPGAKVAVLFQDDAFGEDLLAGLRRGLARSKVRVVATKPVETAADVQVQTASLKASGANVLALFVDQTVANLGWRPQIVVGPVASSEGSISIGFLKDPADPRWRDDTAVRLYRSILARYAKGADVKDVSHVHGMAVAYEVVRILRAAGKNPTRAGLMAQTRRLNDASNPFLLPGISVKTSPNDRFPIEQAVLRHRSKGIWKSFGGLWAYRSG